MNRAAETCPHADSLKVKAAPAGCLHWKIRRADALRNLTRQEIIGHDQLVQARPASISSLSPESGVFQAPCREKARAPEH